MRKARDIPINVIDVSARNQMNQAQHVRAAMSGSNAPSKPVDLSSIQVSAATVDDFILFFLQRRRAKQGGTAH